jgi:uronate dehydrogenase
MKLKRLLITGAAGNLGSMLRRELADMAEVVRLADRHPFGDAGAHEEIVICDLANADAMSALLVDVDAVVHMGGQSTEGEWDSVLGANVVGAINLWEAARRAGTKRIVFASSNHAIGMYPRSVRLDHESPANPDSRYGLSKAFGEDMAKLFAHKFGISAMCIRIGSAFPAPKNSRMLSTWLSYRDLANLVKVGLTADYRYEIVYGVSANTRGWWDNSNAFRLGFRPEDNAEQFVDDVGHLIETDAAARALQGGGMASSELVGPMHG